MTIAKIVGKDTENLTSVGLLCYIYGHAVKYATEHLCHSFLGSVVLLPWVLNGKVGVEISIAIFAAYFVCWWFTYNGWAFTDCFLLGGSHIMVGLLRIVGGAWSGSRRSPSPLSDGSFL